MRIRLAAVTPLVALVVSTLAACGGTTTGGGSGGSSSASGTVANTTLAVASQLASIQAASSSSTCTGGSDGGETCTSTSSGQAVLVLLTNRADATCAFAQSEATSGADDQLASLDLLELGVVAPTGTVAAGTYAIAPPSTTASGAQALFGTSTPTCTTALDLLATSGSITLTEVSADHVAGNYSATFDTQGTFTGSFDVDICTLPDAGNTSTVVDAGQPVCRP